MSVVFGLSICTATTKNSTVGIGNFLLGINFSWAGGGRGLMGSGNTNEKVGLRVIANKLKICS